MESQDVDLAEQNGRTTNAAPVFTAVTLEILWWAAIIGIFSLAQARTEWFYLIFRETFLSSFIDKSVLSSNASVLTTLITPVRGIVFVFSFSILTYPIIKDIYHAHTPGDRSITWTGLSQVALAFAALCVLFFPGQIDGLSREYANSSLVFFSKTATLNYHQRFLMPILANILFFRGEFFFLIFSFLCAFLLTLLVRIWFQRNQVPIPLWQLISLGTASFIYFQISAPGYPDVLINIFIILAFTYPLTTRAKLSLFSFCLVTHEASLMIWLALSWLLFEKKEFSRFLVVGGLYALFWLIADGGVAGVLAGRQSGGITNLQWTWDHPLSELIGILFAFKALWALIVAAVWVLGSQKRYTEAMQICLLLAAGILMTFLGVDTSRLFGWAFMAILISWKILAHAAQVYWTRFIRIVAAINLFIPPVYIQLNFLPSVRPGLYSVIINGLSGLFVR